ncbi:MAG: hypothetical protein M1835_003680 [Candelina submexicana]|nr:MAG: hypothetical protein M1835_003680 [Candelina submexicana]
MTFRLDHVRETITAAAHHLQDDTVLRRMFPEDLLTGHLGIYPSKAPPVNENGTFVGIETTTASEKTIGHNHLGEITGMPIVTETVKITAHLAMTSAAEVRAQLADEISKELKQFHDVDGLEDVRVIRDRKTGGSRGFGFLRFSTLPKSQAFLERNYPTIYLYGNPSAEGDDKAAKVNIAFSRERDERDKAERAEGGWICASVRLESVTGKAAHITDLTIVLCPQLFLPFGMLPVPDVKKW